MAQGNRNNNNRQGNGNGGNGNQKTYSSNEQMSLAEKLTFVLGQLYTRRTEIEPVLPPDLPFDKFHATINQALRNNPKILACTGISIVNACVKSAYDGLRLDGKEAALVDHNVKVSKNPDRWEQQAEYFPMVRGLIKKILMSREVISMEAEVIYQHDTYRVVRGTNPEIYHEPRLDGDRGPAIAYYSVATLKGGHTTAEFMTAADVADVRKEAKTQYVWDRWGGEMGKKSVIRRHEKKLPSGRDMIDVEAREMFPQFDRTQPHPQLADQRAAPPRPTRALPQDNGQPFDMGVQLDMGQRESVVIDQGGQQDQQKSAGAAQTGRNDQNRQGNQQEQGKAAEQERVELPQGDAEWAHWGVDVERKIADAADNAALTEVYNAINPVMREATKAIKDRITKLFTDRAADIAGDTDDGAAAGGSDNAAAAGDE